MKLDFKKEYVNEWKNKLVFAPNGFGKTTSSKRILNELETKNPGSTLLFTRRKMDDLLNFNKNTFYFGEESKMRLENSEIEKKFSKTSSFKQFVKKYYGVTSASNLKSNSFYFNTVGSSNLSLTFLLHSEHKISGEITNENEILSLDKELKYDLFSSIPLDIDKIKKPKRGSRKVVINQNIYEYLDELRKYCESLGLSKCPLCGKNFKNSDNLRKAIAKTFSYYVILDPNNHSDLVEQIYDSLYMAYSSSNFDVLKGMFVNENNVTIDFTDKVATVVNFSNICKNHKESMCSIIRDLDVDGEKAGEMADRFISNQKDIEKLSKSLNKSKMLSFIESEFRKIANLDSSIKFVKDANNLSISLVIDKESKPIDAPDVLSESEAKRLALAVLRAMIKYGKYDCLILDDPLDSYDDYYMSIVCNYIATLLKEKKLKSYYLFTNNNVALFKLSSLLKTSSIILYENPDLVFEKSKSSGLLPVSSFSIIEASYKEIQFINQSEINLLNVFLNTRDSSRDSVGFDIDLSYVAFLTTIRNIKSEVLKKIKNLKLLNDESTKKFQDDVESTIEHCYMHYEPDNAKKLNSLSITVSDVYDLFDALIKVKNLRIHSFKTDITNLNAKRLEQCEKPFALHSGSKLLNLIFKKIIFISQLKFEFEETMIDKLWHNFGFSKVDIEKIVNTNTTGKKLGKIKSLNKKYDGTANAFIDECNRIYCDYSSMVNEFDHAMALMFPPYLNTRIIDIIKYKDSLDDLKSKF